MKLKFLLSSLLFLTGCVTTNTYDQSSLVSSNVIKNDSSVVENANEKIDLLPISKIEIPNYEVDLNSLIVLPKLLDVTLADESKLKLPVKWNRRSVSYRNEDLVQVKGSIMHDKLYEFSTNVKFREFKIDKPIEEYLSIENERIKLYYTENDKQDIKNLLDYLDGVYLESIEFMGLKNLPQIKGYIFPNGVEVNKFLRTRMSVPDNALGWGAGLNEEIFVFVSPNNPPEPTHPNVINDIAHHEMVHTLHFYLASQVPWMRGLESSPTWLAEGLATYLSMSIIMQDIYDPIISKAGFVVSDLNSRDVHNLPYAPGALFIKYLVKTYGNEAFIKYLNTLDFNLSFQKNEAQLSLEFQKYYNELKQKNGLNVSYDKIGYQYPVGYDEDNYLYGYIIREEKTLLYFEDNRTLYPVVERYAYRNGLYLGIANSRFTNEKYFKEYFIIDQTKFGEHFRAADFGINSRTPGSVISKTHNGKRVVYLFLKDGDNLEKVLEQLPLDLFDQDYNYIYE